jgi:hypothetical protein
MATEGATREHGATADREAGREGRRRFGRAIGRRADRGPLLPLDEVTRRLRAYERRYLGVREIPVRQIVGTDSRGGDFDREFVPLRPGIAARVSRVAHAFPNGDFPPIVVYQVGDAYFVVDGHHRVAIARQRGMETIDAEVTSLRTRWRLPAEADIVAVIHAEQEQMFLEQSGLAGTHPDAPIRFSRPAGYLELLENVQIHGYHLMLDAGRVLTRDEIARDWYERVYLPAVDAIRRERLDAVSSGATESDLFLCVYQRRRDLFPNTGCRPLEDVAREWTAESENGTRRRLRRLLGRRVD